VIEVSGIAKSYGELQVLKGVDLSIAQGSVVSIVGSSGAGKSTLLHIMGTLDYPDRGKVLIDGVETNALKKNDLAKFRNHHLGFVFQFHHLLPEFTALENICIPAFIKNIGKKEAEQSAYELLDYLGLKDRATHKPNELSGGEQQRVAVARALINKPKVVFADEPSGNLDSENSTELHQLFFDLRDQYNQTFVVVTHNNELADMADKKLVMVDGKLAE